MKYLTKSLMQRFMSHMTTNLRDIQAWRKETEEQILWEKDLNAGQKIMSYWYNFRQKDKIAYVKNSQLQEMCKRGFIGHPTLQRMEKVVTDWIKSAEWQKYYTHQNYLDNRYDTFYRNKTKQAKQRLAKLVELQQAIRKQKSISGDSF